ncbi:MAG: hypothetical protein J1F42_01455 [Lachnospiraceae bacterium]|nr:hypothetical protein [Lachnospiraceae bacterium]
MSSKKGTYENKKNKKRAYLNDFQKDETGAYIYRGIVYDYAGSEQGLRSLKVRLCIFGILTLAALLLSGLIRVPGMDHSVYVLLPYAAALCGSVSVCWAVGCLCISGISIRAYLFQESIEKLPTRCIFTACCSVGALLGELAYILITGIEIRNSGCIPFLILQSISITSTLLLRSRIMRTRWHQSNETAAKSNTPSE